ncbi:MAG: DUF4395 domain-containing protein [Anaerolineales bacterium]|nr:DUF4395 domain-containing protein [Anaerolineales bacterium]
MDELESIDHTAIFVSQVSVVVLNLLAFVLDQPWLAVLVTIFMLLGALLDTPGFGWVYRLALRPLGLARPHVLADYPEPHRFSQGFGATVMVAGSLGLFLQASLFGWTLVGLVAALAALNAFGGFCLGCFVYYWLGRLGLPGFTRRPPAGTFPGRRPGGALADEH